MLEIISDTRNQTPIEIALGVDEKGRTTARKLYEFLDLAKGQFSRWAKTNILENPFAENRVDYEGFDINVEGNKTVDYKLTASFAKKLAMGCQNERGEQARQYFIKVEDMMKEEKKKPAKLAPNRAIQEQLAEAKVRNARSRQASMWLKIAQNIDIKEYKQICASYASGVLNGTENIIPLPECTERYYTATEVGEMCGVTKNKIGRIANDNNMKSDEYGKWYHDKSQYCSKEVDTFKYNEKAIKKFKELMNING